MPGATCVVRAAGVAACCGHDGLVGLAHAPCIGVRPSRARFGTAHHCHDKPDKIMWQMYSNTVLQAVAQ